MRFNWHKEGETFRKWAVINLMSGDPTQDKEQFDKLSKATKNFEDVEITMQINGIEMDVTGIFEGIESNMNFFAENAAQEFIRSLTPVRKLEEAMEEMSKDLKDAQRAINRQLRSTLKEAGVSFDASEDDYYD